MAVVRAIMRYALDVKTEGFNIHTAGMILLVVGIGVVLFGLIAMLLGAQEHDHLAGKRREHPHGPSSHLGGRPDFALGRGASSDD